MSAIPPPPKKITQLLPKIGEKVKEKIKKMSIFLNGVQICWKLIFAQLSLPRTLLQVLRKFYIKQIL